jgi:hypothetical protein
MGWADLIFNLVLCLGDLLSFFLATHELNKRTRLAGPGPYSHGGARALLRSPGSSEPPPAPRNEA